MSTTAYIMKTLRLGLFYMVIKNHLYRQVDKSKKRRMMRLEEEKENAITADESNSVD